MLKDEPHRLVRMYLYPALRKVGYDEPQSIALLKERFASLDESNTEPKHEGSKSDYTDADEKISVASALYVLVQGPDRKVYLNFILKWLRPDEQLTVGRREGLWNRRRLVVLVWENMPDGGEAIS